MGEISLLIADDHPAFLEGLSRLLQDEEDLNCIAKSRDGQEAIEAARELNPDVVIIDVSMPKLNGIEAAKQIKKSCPGTAILMISGFEYQSYIVASFQAGASGYMSKNSPLNDIISAIKLVHNGGKVLGLKGNEDMISHFSAYTSEADSNNNQLQPRELEVIQLAAKGMSNKAIATELFISERTVQTHLVNIFRKIGVNSRTQAVLYILKKGWITLDNVT